MQGAGSDEVGIEECVECAMQIAICCRILRLSVKCRDGTIGTRAKHIRAGVRGSSSETAGSEAL
jgi:hypothetical protein